MKCLKHKIFFTAFLAIVCSLFLTAAPGMTKEKTSRSYIPKRSAQIGQTEVVTKKPKRIFNTPDQEVHKTFYYLAQGKISAEGAALILAYPELIVAMNKPIGESPEIFTPRTPTMDDSPKTRKTFSTCSSRVEAVAIRDLLGSNQNLGKASKDSCNVEFQQPSSVANQLGGSKGLSNAQSAH